MRSWKKYSKFLLSVGMLTLFGGPAFAAEEWEGRLRVKSGAAESRLAFGQRSDATPGVDGHYDVPAMFGGNLKAWFDLDGAPYWRDIQGLTQGEGQWDFQVESGRLGATIEFSWQVPTSLPGALFLVDPSLGQRIDLRQQSSFRYVNQGPRQFQLMLSSE